MIKTLCLTVFLAVTPIVAASHSTAMIATYPAFRDALLHARSVNVTSYILPANLRETLIQACRQGEHVTVLLAQPSYDPEVEQDNNDAVRGLRSAGCAARTTQSPLHMKLAYMDGSAWLSDTNFSSEGFLVRADDPQIRSVIASTLARGEGAHSETFATRKDWALDLESATIAQLRGPICVSTESFGRGEIAGDLASYGGPIRLVIARREFQESRSEQQLVGLLRQLPGSIDIRAGDANEKIAVGTDRAWFGSANATAGLPTQIDWGMVSTDPAIVAVMQSRCLADWKRASPLQ